MTTVMMVMRRVTLMVNEIKITNIRLSTSGMRARRSFHRWKNSLNLGSIQNLWSIQNDIFMLLLGKKILMLLFNVSNRSDYVLYA